uniref:SPRY domain-containing SOCS box protein 3 n=1 Tax=Tetraodon nigroviridis TaxID=99883 RepID=H3D5I7_TETNG
NQASRNPKIRTAMLRRGRNGRARHLFRNETWQDADALAPIQTPEQEEQEGLPMGQVSPEGEVLSSVVPVLGESFCQCDQQQEVTPGLPPCAECFCGEDDQGLDWEWDTHFKSSGAFLSCGNRKVSFHLDYSSGTAAIRGTKELADGQHFWEVKMTSPVYGTDMVEMVGIGTSEVNLEKFKYNFGSLLGHDEASWGLSYTGYLQHKGDKVRFSSQFGQGSIIGVHLDTWHGTLTFYKNRHCIGVAATKLQNQKFYPMVCSTAAKSSMKVIRACYTPTSLQYLCCVRLRQTMPRYPDVLRELEVPPGLRTLLHVRLGWVFTLSRSSRKSPLSDYDSCCSEPEDYQSKRCRWT